MSDLTVKILTEVSDSALASVNRLLPQLSSSASELTLDDLHQLVTSDSTNLLVAEDSSGNFLGMLTLVVFFIPTGVRAWIEDVVVDQAARGQGVGEALSRAAVELAQTKGAVSVDLTSRPSREAANRLYQRMGFVPRETNVYRYGG